MSAAPPFWQIDIQKRLGTEFWTNVWHVARSTQAAAQTAASAIVELERGLHTTDVEFTSYRVAPFPGPAEGTIIPIGLTGVQNAVNYIPLFNVMRVDFPAPTGRPSRKYWRLPVSEVMIENGVFTPAMVTAYQSNIDSYFASPGSAGLIDVDGQLLVSGRVIPSVGMRQLRRGSRRRLQPII